ncbi:7615_t:CDS:2, partial [Ambispora leptoticha]
ADLALLAPDIPLDDAILTRLNLDLLFDCHLVDGTEEITETKSERIMTASRARLPLAGALRERPQTINMDYLEAHEGY